MIRIEIIAHEALEKPLLEVLAPIPPGVHDPEGRSGRPYTLLRGAAGRGLSGSSFGDDIWPETNILIILFAEEDEKTEIRRRVCEIRRRFPKLGLAVFAAPGYDEWYDEAEGDV